MTRPNFNWVRKVSVNDLEGDIGFHTRDSRDTRCSANQVSTVVRRPQPASPSTRSTKAKSSTSMLATRGRRKTQRCEIAAAIKLVSFFELVCELRLE